MWFWFAMVVWAGVVAAFALNRSMGLPTLARFLIYLVGIPLVAFAAGAVVVSATADNSCDGDCDLAGLAFLGIGVVGTIVGLCSAIFFEGVRALARAADRYQERRG